MAFHQPDIDPILFSIPHTPLAVRWYSLLYVGGFLVGRVILNRLSKQKRFLFTANDVEQLIVWFLVSAVAGARIFYCLFYDWGTLLQNPFYLFQVYRGGLSFHGALIGIILTTIIYTRRHGIPFWNLADAMAFATPIGLGMGRLGNFINGELFGRPTDVPWAIIFKDGGPAPRHPSQLYELVLEGVLLMTLLIIAKKKTKRNGTISLAFLLGYSACRFIAEFFREPDPQLGYLSFGLSMGQILSIVMFGISGAVGYWIFSKPGVGKVKAR